MDIRELRIGNFIDYIYLPKNEVVRVDLNFMVNMHKDITYLCNFLPIPLTEEWLVKFGFDVDIDKTLPHIKAYSKGGIIFDSEFYLTVEGAESELHSIGNPLKYVHQLQNLYFALTGEELTIK